HQLQAQIPCGCLALALDKIHQGMSDALRSSGPHRLHSVRMMSHQTLTLDHYPFARVLLQLHAMVSNPSELDLRSISPSVRRDRFSSYGHRRPPRDATGELVD